jgi:hypothetical protein
MISFFTCNMCIVLCINFLLCTHATCFSFVSAFDAFELLHNSNASTDYRLNLIHIYTLFTHLYIMIHLLLAAQRQSRIINSSGSIAIKCPILLRVNFLQSCQFLLLQSSLHVAVPRLPHPIRKLFGSRELTIEPLRSDVPSMLDTLT